MALVAEPAFDSDGALGEPAGACETGAYANLNVLVSAPQAQAGACQ